uniref:HNH endonuclease n=1 Tax=unclassified Thalassolituus TaxID=2624967 RepID=UPI0025F270AB
IGSELLHINDSELQPLRNELPSLYALDQINIKAAPAENPKPSQLPWVTPDVAPSHSAEQISPHRLNRDDVLKLPQAALQAAWERRPHSFLTLSAASEALASIRFLSGIDPQKKPWSAFTESDIIQAMYDQLEDDSDSAPLRATPEAESSLIGLDQRTRSSRVQVLRIGQKEFRDLVVRRYSGQCCFTGCTEAAVLEAAHIMPYMGDHSNLIDNGLLLRVDLHRLFDRFLISVNPDDLSLAISKNIHDAYYQSLSGRSLSITVTNLTRQFLKRHYDTFMKVCK